ncbi:MAG: glycosyl hydrolase family 28-related protein, partial [Tepidisphaeraceae bacterium]
MSKKFAPTRRQRRCLLESLEHRCLLAGGPTASLSASAISLWTSTYQFKVTYKDNVAVRGSTVDGNDLLITGPNGYSRKASFIAVNQSGDGPVRSGRYKISQTDGVWDARDNGTYTVSLRANQVSDTSGNAASAGVIGSFKVSVPDYPSTFGAGPAVPPGALDIRRYGAVANDGKDDTAAIQAAIDALPRSGDGVPDAIHVMGGTVLIPTGTFNVNGIVMIRPGVRVLGLGESSVVTSARVGGSVFQFYSPYSHGANIRAGISGLSINTTSAAAISVDPDMPNDLIGVRLSDLVISAGGAAIDLSEVNTYLADIRDVTVVNPGSTALWIGKDGGFGGVNRISNFAITGAARPGFSAPRGLIYGSGHITARNITIEDLGTRLQPMTFANANLDIAGVHINTAASRLISGSVINFSHGSFEIDRLDNLNKDRRLQISTSSLGFLGTLSLTSGALIGQAVSVDSSSHLNLDVVRTATAQTNFNTAYLSVLKVLAPDAGSSPDGGPEDPTGPLSSSIVDVTRFGAAANDGIDDTAAVQAAIDSLPRGSGIPGTGSAVGGLVVFPRGRFN